MDDTINPYRWMESGNTTQYVIATTDVNVDHSNSLVLPYGNKNNEIVSIDHYF